MGVNNTKGTFYNSLFSLFLCVWLCPTDNIHGFKFEIIRGNRDNFSNFECSKKGEDGSRCTSEQCKRYGAKCGTDNCAYCICKGKQKTFLLTKDDLIYGGICKSDDDFRFTGM